MADLPYPTTPLDLLQPAGPPPPPAPAPVQLPWWATTSTGEQPQLPAPTNFAPFSGETGLLESATPQSIWNWSNPIGSETLQGTAPSLLTTPPSPAPDQTLPMGSPVPGMGLSPTGYAGVPGAAGGPSGAPAYTSTLPAPPVPPATPPPLPQYGPPAPPDTTKPPPPPPPSGGSTKPGSGNLPADTSPATQPAPASSPSQPSMRDLTPPTAQNDPMAALNQYIMSQFPGAEPRGPAQTDLVSRLIRGLAPAVTGGLVNPPPGLAMTPSEGSQLLRSVGAIGTTMTRLASPGWGPPMSPAAILSTALDAGQTQAYSDMTAAANLRHQQLSDALQAFHLYQQNALLQSLTKPRPAAAPTTAAPAPTGGAAGGGTGFGRPLAGSTYEAAIQGHEGLAADPRPGGAVGGFIPGTWQDFMKARPDLFAGKTPEQAMALRSDPAINTQAITWYAQQTAAQLGKAGAPVNGQSLGLAHYLGASRVPAIMAAPDSDLVSKYVPQKTLDNNNEPQGLTVGQLKARYANVPNPSFLGPNAPAALPGTPAVTPASTGGGGGGGGGGGSGTPLPPVPPLTAPLNIPGLHEPTQDQQEDWDRMDKLAIIQGKGDLPGTRARLEWARQNAEKETFLPANAAQADILEPNAPKHSPLVNYQVSTTSGKVTLDPSSLGRQLTPAEVQSEHLDPARGPWYVGENGIPKASVDERATQYGIQNTEERVNAPLDQDQRVKDWRDATSIYGRVLSGLATATSTNNPVSDREAMLNLLRLQNPHAQVTEASLRDSSMFGGLPQQLAQYFASWKGDAPIPQQLREQIGAAARDAMASQDAGMLRARDEAFVRAQSYQAAGVPIIMGAVAGGMSPVAMTQDEANRSSLVSPGARTRFGSMQFADPYDPKTFTHHAPEATPAGAPATPAPTTTATTPAVPKTAADVGGMSVADARTYWTGLRPADRKNLPADMRAALLAKLRAQS